MKRIRAEKSPYISVVIPAYNEEKYLGDCLASLAHQTSSVPFEVIVVDNNSTDNTVSVAKKWGAKVVKQIRQGRPFAREAGALAAWGKILAFTEADCITPATWIEDIYKLMNSDQEIAGIAGSFRFLSPPIWLGLIQPAASATDAYINRVKYGHFVFKGVNFAIKRDIFLQVRGFKVNHSPMGDISLGIRAGKYGKILYAPNLVVQTSDRRIRQRLWTYLWNEYFQAQLTLTFKLNNNDSLYDNIR